MCGGWLRCSQLCTCKSTRICGVTADGATFHTNRFRSYVNGCQFKLFETRVGPGLAGHELLDVAECLYRETGLLVIGESIGDESGHHNIAAGRRRVHESCWAPCSSPTLSTHSGNNHQASWAPTSACSSTPGATCWPRVK